MSVSIDGYSEAGERVGAILADVEFRGRTFFVADGAEYLQVRWVGTDSTTGEPAVQYGRKWKLSPHMTKSELVQTAFKAALAAEEHEVREDFRYRGRAIFGPHFDVDDLVDLAGSGRRDVRAPDAPAPAPVFDWPCGCQLGALDETIVCPDHDHEGRPTADAPPVQLLAKRWMEQESELERLEAQP